jgi:hypothetical protein
VIFALVNEGSSSFRVRHTGRDRGDLVISLVAAEELPPPKAVLQEIAIPVDLRGCHPIVRATKEAVKPDRDGWIDTRRTRGIAHLKVHKDSLRRSLLLLQAIADEAGRRGWRVLVHKSYGCEGGFGVEVAGHPFEVTVKETRRVEYVLTEAERRRYDRGYSEGRRWDYVPTGRLLLRDDHNSYGPPLATDRQRWSVEERLPQLFARLEENAEIAEARRVEAELRRQKEEEAREAAFARAARLLVEHHRAEWLVGQLSAYRTARDAREFVAAAMSSRELDDDERDWLEWVAAHAERIDPLHRALEPPEPPEPTTENLRPFLTGLSPSQLYGMR